VSTERQGQHGYGIDAQRKAVTDYINQTSSVLLGEFVEVESGRRSDNRPELAKALGASKRQHAKLIIAKLDRLSRNVAFIATLMDGDVDFICCDFPSATRFTMHILAAVAEHERHMISERTKAGLAAAKARGVQIGNLRNLPDAQAKGLRVRKALADAHAARVLPVILDIQKNGQVESLVAIAAALTARGVPTARGGQWSGERIRRVIQRATGTQGPPKRKARFDAFDAQVLPVIREIQGEGSLKRMIDIAAGLNTRGMRTANDTQWSGSAVRRVFDRTKQARPTRTSLANAFAIRVMPVIQEIQQSGIVSVRGIAATLTSRGVFSPRGCKWRDSQVRSVIKRAEAKAMHFPASQSPSRE